MSLLGIDIGTGGTRAVVVDRGKILASATEVHPPFDSPRIGWAEQDPRQWWRACCAAVSRVLKTAGPSADRIACVGVSGQMHGAVLLGSDDEPVRAAPLWCDQRSELQSRCLNEQIGIEKLLGLTCNASMSNFTLTKLLWVRENEPERWKQVCSILLPKDYVRFMLTGELATDVTDASGTLLLDVANRRWSDELLERAQIDARLLPTVFESAHLCGQVSSMGAAATGLRAGTPVVAGAGDQAAGALSMGVVRPGAVSATIGTSGVVFAATETPVCDPVGRLHTFCHAVPGCWHVMGVTQAAGLSLRWFRDQFGHAGGIPEPYEVLCAEAAAVAAGTEGLLWIPYMMGERAPHLDPGARAALVGLTFSHTRAHVIRAILEGVALSLRDVLEVLREIEVPVTRIRLGGGGSRSRLWCQIQADAYEQEVETTAVREGAALGAALLAGVGVKVWPSVEEACEAVERDVERIAPCPRSAVRMRSNYASYRRAYPALKQIFGQQAV